MRHIYTFNLGRRIDSALKSLTDKPLVPHNSLPRQPFPDCVFHVVSLVPPAPGSGHRWELGPSLLLRSLHNLTMSDMAPCQHSSACWRGVWILEQKQKPSPPEGGHKDQRVTYRSGWQVLSQQLDFFKDLQGHDITDIKRKATRDA